MNAKKRNLQAALVSQNPDQFEIALRKCFPVSRGDGLGEILTLALKADWHFRHEDVAMAIQDLRWEAACDALEARAHNVPDYLKWDENLALPRKCTWALADIGTNEARMALERLAKSDGPKLRAFAQERLGRWDIEFNRKGLGE